VLGCGEGLPEAGTADALGASTADVRAWTAAGLTRLGRLLGSPDDAALAARLRRELPARAAGVVAPEGLAEDVLTGSRTLRWHLVGLAALAAFVVLVLVAVLAL
jgi:hypothetical protein